MKVTLAYKHPLKEKEKQTTWHQVSFLCLHVFWHHPEGIEAEHSPHQLAHGAATVIQTTWLECYPLSVPSRATESPPCPPRQLFHAPPQMTLIQTNYPNKTNNVTWLLDLKNRIINDYYLRNNNGNQTKWFKNRFFLTYFYTVKTVVEYVQPAPK